MVTLIDADTAIMLMEALDAGATCITVLVAFLLDLYAVWAYLHTSWKVGWLHHSQDIDGSLGRVGNRRVHKDKQSELEYEHNVDP